MPWAIPVAIAGGMVISSLIGQAASASEREQAISQNQAAVKAWLDQNVPDPNQQKVQLAAFINTGKLTPTLQQAVNQTKSQMNDIQTNPQASQAQLNALDQLKQLGENGGMTIADQANLQNSLNNAAATNRGNVGAIQNNMEARGLGGSGLELQAQLQNAQNTNQTINQDQLSAAGMAQQRALQAIQQSGQLGGQIEGQQFGEQAAKAQAQDAINRFNSQNMNAINTLNTNRLNDANAYNVQNAQNISNANTNVANQQNMYNSQLKQQAFLDQLAKTQGLANQYTNAGNFSLGQAGQTAQSYANIGSGIAQGAGAYGQYLNNQNQIDAYNNRTNSMNGANSGGGNGYSQDRPYDENAAGPGY